MNDGEIIKSNLKQCMRFRIHFLLSRNCTQHNVIYQNLLKGGRFQLNGSSAHKIKRTKMTGKGFFRSIILLRNSENWNRPLFSTHVDVDLKVTNNNDIIKNGKESDKNALPFKKIPGPSKLSLLTSFLPGGKYYKQTLMDVFFKAKNEYGDLLFFPGVFGTRGTLLAFNPADFEKVFRADGQWPNRRTFDIMNYYRKKIRPEFYKTTCGLGAEQGESWGRIRSLVNPIMMQPQAMKFYIPWIDEIVFDFIQRIRQIRNSATNEVPSNFNEEIQYFSMENVVFLTLDTRLGLLNGLPKSEETKRFSCAITDFFVLLYELDRKPSLWKFIPTPNFTKMIKTQDIIFKTCSKHIEKAIERINSAKLKNVEKSVLEKLLQIDKDVAAILALDMIGAGIDTTSAAFTACLFQLAKNPEKQQILRDEIKAILPHKDTPLNKTNMQNLPYLRACIKEAFRLNPVTSMNHRYTGQDLVLNGYEVPKGTGVAMVYHFLLRDNRHYPQADKFLPERWLRNQPQEQEVPSTRTANPFINLPFGFGPRMCIGRRFVNLEIEIALARIIRNFYLEYNHPDFIFNTTIINTPSGDFGFKFIDLFD